MGRRDVEEREQRWRDLARACWQAMRWLSRRPPTVWRCHGRGTLHHAAETDRGDRGTPFRDKDERRAVAVALMLPQRPQLAAKTMIASNVAIFRQRSMSRPARWRSPIGRVRNRDMVRVSCSSISCHAQRSFSPEVLELRRRQLSVSHRVLNVLMTQVLLQRPRIVAPVSERVPARMTQHVRVCFK